MGEFGRQGHKIAQLAERQHGHVTRVQLLATTSALIPPATAPPMIGIHRLKVFMLYVSSPELV